MSLKRNEALEKMQSFQHHNISNINELRLINQIYDDFESRRCKTCRFFVRSVVLSEVQDYGTCKSDHKSTPFSADINFGCVYWKRRK